MYLRSVGSSCRPTTRSTESRTCDSHTVTVTHLRPRTRHICSWALCTRMANSTLEIQFSFELQPLHHIQTPVLVPGQTPLLIATHLPRQRRRLGCPHHLQLLLRLVGVGLEQQVVLPLLAEQSLLDRRDTAGTGPSHKTGESIVQHMTKTMHPCQASRAPAYPYPHPGVTTTAL